MLIMAGTTQILHSDIRKRSIPVLSSRRNAQLEIFAYSKPIIAHSKPIIAHGKPIRAL
jgi:hypothetical protein